MAVILFSTNVSHLIHLSVFSTVSMLNNRFSTHLTTWLLCWELGRGATARAQSIGKIAISGAFCLVWLYNVFHSICNISKVILWSLGKKKQQLHEEKIYLTQQLERIGFSPDCDGEVMPTGRGVVNLQGNKKKRQLRSHQAEAKPQQRISQLLTIQTAALRPERWLSG